MTDQMTDTPPIQTSDLRLRPYAGEADLPHIVALENAESEQDRIPSHTSVEEVRARYGNPNQTFDPGRDVTIAELNGEIVGYGERQWVDTTDGLREYRVGGAVHPAWRRRSIGTALHELNVERARELAATHETPRPKFIGSWTAEHQAGSAALLRGHGFQQVRWFFDMVRPTLDDIPDLPLPAGIDVRPATPDLYRQIWQADVEAFLDHWGGFDDSEENMRRFFDRPSTDPTMWVIGWDGDEVAGGVINAIHPEENEALGVQRAWLHSVFTRRPWRRHGLARALIARSLAVIRERGMTSAVLGVDADNPTGALGLYEGLGFEVDARFSAWRKPL
jgi:mycothiol synthase